eukprot:CAMPEP_0119280104 /NCGR_PEP_ID=MMETSP1329-20130426/22073_1 /TAXON_ID=114041 /ORGANISM="Genus nov. species nov., Strain RCC1024" /LENGTH=42 /DNA_ID= /DNA_START= /DNA_END= /DNA_ORIENTATION=
MAQSEPDVAYLVETLSSSSPGRGPKLRAAADLAEALARPDGE